MHWMSFLTNAIRQVENNWKEIKLSVLSGNYYDIKKKKTRERQGKRGFIILSQFNKVSA